MNLEVLNKSRPKLRIAPHYQICTNDSRPLIKAAAKKEKKIFLLGDEISNDAFGLRQKPESSSSLNFLFWDINWTDAIKKNLLRIPEGPHLTWDTENESYNLLNNSRPLIKAAPD